ncbi:type II toxin-antitoxin system mRNA interferase toxin, RelE/StbE family [Thiomicrorhabdus sp. 6S2-11]|uniref:Type II toxin-antitoxin system mRNA interferase toxin, RelE/StbE family n=1 Tax=Thiomicrorhabdus marina TaxID=2818442 RepID=A0ABS3Q2Y2_9GAMM|nr:type II toxin-antitoxin system mRNA interferase toxin, RelE/StbE family [Thiomicrorhabdus marina]MBO1926304.1 type II toxin-antitoxin system mRNA interferase toxin, RelE/StbE family [Thiomicrorhabdus marina]
MNYKIIRTDEYFKKLKKFIKKHPEVLPRYGKTIELLEIDPFHPSLRLHKLQGSLKEYYSVSINMKYRVVIDFVIQDNHIIPIDIGSHDEVY